MADTTSLQSLASDLVLMFRGGERAGQCVRIDSRKCYVGSSPQATLCLRSNLVSPIHCLILRGTHTTQLRSFVRDTRVNGRTVESKALSQGDLISIGPIELEIISLAFQRQEPLPKDQLPTSNSLDEQAQWMSEQLARLKESQDEFDRSKHLVHARTRRLVNDLREAKAQIVDQQDKIIRQQDQIQSDRERSDWVESRLMQLEQKLEEIEKRAVSESTNDDFISIDPELSFVERSNEGATDSSDFSSSDTCSVGHEGEYASVEQQEAQSEHLTVQEQGDVDLDLGPLSGVDAELTHGWNFDDCSWSTPTVQDEPVPIALDDASQASTLADNALAEPVGVDECSSEWTDEAEVPASDHMPSLVAPSIEDSFTPVAEPNDSVKPIDPSDEASTRDNTNELGNRPDHESLMLESTENETPSLEQTIDDTSSENDASEFQNSSESEPTGNESSQGEFSLTEGLFDSVLDTMEHERTAMDSDSAHSAGFDKEDEQTNPHVAVSSLEQRLNQHSESVVPVDSTDAGLDVDHGSYEEPTIDQTIAEPDPYQSNDAAPEQQVLELSAPFPCTTDSETLSMTPEIAESLGISVTSMVDEQASQESSFPTDESGQNLAGVEQAPESINSPSDLDAENQLTTEAFSQSNNDLGGPSVSEAPIEHSEIATDDLANIGLNVDESTTFGQQPFIQSVADESNGLSQPVSEAPTTTPENNDVVDASLSDLRANLAQLLEPEETGLDTERNSTQDMVDGAADPEPIDASVVVDEHQGEPEQHESLDESDSPQGEVATTESDDDPDTPGAGLSLSKDGDAQSESTTEALHPIDQAAEASHLSLDSDDESTTASDSDSVAFVETMEPESSGEEEEESIEEYMSKLLRRVRGENDDQTLEPANPVVVPERKKEAKKEKPRKAKPVAERTEADVLAEAFAPEIAAREKEFESERSQRRVEQTENRDDLQAMREVANSSARSAIRNSKKRQEKTTATLQLGGAVGAIVMGAAFMGMGSGVSKMPFLMGIGCWCVAVLLGYRLYTHYKTKNARIVNSMKNPKAG